MKKLCDFFCDHRNLSLFVAGASIVVLGTALIMHYGFNILPCHLCYLQRKPYWATIALGILGFLGAKKAPRATFVLLLLAGATFLYGAGMAFFHTGVEHGWWETLKGCGGEGATLPANATVEELKEYLKNRPIVDCRVPGFKLLGFSLTEYNLLGSTVLSLFTFFHAIKGRKGK